jgi:hypothetical protein
MAQFHTNYSTAAFIEKLIEDARERITLISPFWRFPENLYQRLVQAGRRGVLIRIVFGKEELETSQRGLMEQLEHLELFFYEHLHAKCYSSEKHLIVSSLNFHEFSERHNREMSVSLEPGEEAFDAAMREVESIIAASQREERVARGRGGVKQPAVTRPSTAAPHARGREESGFCIRCGDSLPFNPDRPFCCGCYAEWGTNDTPEHPRDFCHRCGKRNDTSAVRPLCYSCFRSL